MYRFTRKNSDFSPHEVYIRHFSHDLTTLKHISQQCRPQIAAGIFIGLYLPPEIPRIERAYNTIDMKFRNANVLITGGASGIGKIMGRRALSCNGQLYRKKITVSTENNLPL